MNKHLSFLMILLPFLAKAQNPIIRDQYTADPTARVFNGKVYLYPSHDIIPPKGVASCENWFCMEDYHVFSSENLTQWTDHGVIVTQNKIPWVRKDNYAMWAPDCVYKDGKYYFYFPTIGDTTGYMQVGVAIADKPEGPFIPEPKPIDGIIGTDPNVLIASDGNAYIYWSNARVAKLKPNMKEIADDTPSENVQLGNYTAVWKGKALLNDLPNNQAEGTFVFEYNGYYYLTYPYVREDTEVLGYAMGKDPMGPFEYKGLIMAEHPNKCWTNHHSIINYKGQWYLFYHHNPFSPNDNKRRSVQIEKLFFNEDGTIQEVKATMRGVGINQATEKIEIDRYSTASKDVTTSLIDIEHPFLSFQATLPAKGSWIQYNDVDFDCIGEDGSLITNVKASEDTKFCIREGSVDGKIIACVDMTKTKDWGTQTVSLEYVPKGVINLVVTNESGGTFSIDWVKFTNEQDELEGEFEEEVEDVSAELETADESSSEDDDDDDDDDDIDAEL